MKYKVVWTSEASRDLENIINYYLTEASEAVALSVSSRIHADISSLDQFPFRCREGRVAETHECVISRLPYIGVVKVEGDTVHVLAVLHTARKYPKD